MLWTMLLLFHCKLLSALHVTLLSVERCVLVTGLEHMHLSLMLPAFSALVSFGKSHIFSQDRREVKNQLFISQQHLKYPFGGQKSIWRMRVREKDYAFNFSCHAPNILYENLGSPTPNTFKM